MPPALSLVLASASSGRLGTLRRAGLDPIVVVSGVDEDIPETDPGHHALELAERKADAVVLRTAAPGLVLGCDSVLDLDGEIHGKPATASIAVERWRRMRGRTGVLRTGHCLIDVASGRRISRLVSTTVHFASVSDDEIDAYVATGEPMRVAGAFTLDGLGGPFVRGVEGDPHNVVGLSLPVLREMVVELGHAWPDLWATSG